MNGASPQLSLLSRDAASTVARPPSRWKTRVLFPLVLIAALGSVLGYAARSALRPAVGVWVAPVVALPRAPADTAGASSAGAPPVILAQAPGWIEADPYFVIVPALTGGVVKEVLVLEGQPVEAGQVVARLIDDDARLEVRRLSAELAARAAEVERAKAARDAALARAQEVRDEVQRKRDLVEAGGISEGQFARLELRLQSMERDAAAAKSEVTVAEAAERMHRVACEIAELALERTEIRSPSAGVVVSRLVEPGSRVLMASPGSEPASMPGAIVRLYNPLKLQSRVDVPLADFAKLGVGTRAEVLTETLPGRVFGGAITRIVNEADIQRNTVQVKVAIKDPDPALKPEMLTKVRFLSAPGTPPSGAGGSPGGVRDASTRLLVPRGSLRAGAGSRASVWLIDQSSAADGPVARSREVETAPSSGEAFVEIVGGLQPGDRLVIDAPAGLSDGSHVKVLGERVPVAHGDQ